MDETPVFPALKTIRIQGTHFDLDALVDLLQYRPVSYLIQSVHFHFDHQLTADTQCEFKAFQARTIDMLQDHAEVVFHVKSRPIITLPQVCTAPDDWKWKGYDWASLSRRHLSLKSA